MKKYSLFEKTQFTTIGIVAIIGALLVILKHTSLLDESIGVFEAKLDKLFTLAFIFFSGLSIGGVLKEQEIMESDSDDE